MTQWSACIQGAGLKGPALYRSVSILSGCVGQKHTGRELQKSPKRFQTNPSKKLKHSNAISFSPFPMGTFCKHRPGGRETQGLDAADLPHPVTSPHSVPASTHLRPDLHTSHHHHFKNEELFFSLVMSLLTREITKTL